MNGPLVILPTDFSAASRAAFPPVFKLARQLKGRVAVVSVVPDLKAIPFGAILAPPQSSPELPQQVERARSELERLAAEFPADVPVETDVVTGEYVAQSICSYAAERCAAYIALASHGHSNLRRLLMGSVTSAVLSETDLPVIVYPRIPEPGAN